VVVTATNAVMPQGITATTTAIVYAAYTWNGSVSTDGATPRNWTPYTGQAPMGYDDVTVPAKPMGQYWPEVSGAWRVDDLTLDSGSALTLLDGAQLVVDGTVDNAGTLRQTVATVPAGSTTRFLHIQDAAGRVDQYLGVDITPAEALGPVTVAVTGQAACPQATGPTVQRCFTVVGAGTATLMFHYLERERAGLDAATMQVWHWDKAAQQWGLVGNVSGRDTGSAHYAVTVEGVVLDASGTRFVLRPNNVLPEAGDDSVTVTEHSGATKLDVLANDTDADGDTLRVYAVGPLDQRGTLVNAGTHVVYTPAPDFFGTERFTYIVSDGFGGLDTATVAVAVTAVVDNRAPVADAGGDQSVEPGVQVILDGSGSYDPDGDPLTYYWTQDGGPVVQFESRARATTFAVPMQEGTMLTFTLTVTDLAGLSDSDRAVIRVARMHRLYLPLMVKGVVGRGK
jgi:hypothetical protein